MKIHSRETVHTFHTTRFKFLRHYIIIFIFLFLGIGNIFIDFLSILNIQFLESSLFSLISPIIFIIVVIIIVILEVKVREEKITIDSHEIRIEHGLLHQNDVTVRLESITDYKISQTPFQRLLNYGGIEIGVPGSTVHENMSIHGGNVNINAPVSARAVVLNYVQNIEKMKIILSHHIKGKHRKHHR